ncbi:hypothetical protein [Actinoplanes sp. URMC 104]|uniref:hypothetical protein n=1 Tax=Actinoplanes sp. URMC 104 TaxID=3423409 RepID=UPI003F1A98E6
MTGTEIDVYPVGWLKELQLFRRALHAGPDARRWAAGRLRRQARSNLRHIRRRQWRDLKNTFNGYLAEPYEFPAGVTCCGTGWTRARARRDLDRLVRAAGARR